MGPLHGTYSEWDGNKMYFQIKERREIREILQPPRFVGRGLDPNKCVWFRLLLKHIPQSHVHIPITHRLHLFRNVCT